MIAQYLVSFFLLLIADYTLTKIYKSVFTWQHVMVTLFGSCFLAILLWYTSPERFIDSFVRLTSMGLLAEITLYFVVIKYKLLKQI